MITLILGGARSGKSFVAEQLAGKTGAHVTYVATVNVDGDTDLANRVMAHQLRRPVSWSNIENNPHLTKILEETSDTILIDSLGPWLAALPSMDPDIERLCAALTKRTGDTILVSDEVGLGVHPETPMGRSFRDALGLLNQAIAEVADDVLLVVAGRILPLQPPPQ
jgi:adenosyl cobinamide kinase/adenosyl cobinamide phosphate guanylyltransferase